jgi:hypothetical protein
MGCDPRRRLLNHRRYSGLLAQPEGVLWTPTNESSGKMGSSPMTVRGGQMRSTELITIEEFGNLTPRDKGYAVCMQGDLPGSELQGLPNPYAQDTLEYQQWNEGQALAAQERSQRAFWSALKGV